MSGDIQRGYKIISVGGTGQMVLHYYLQLYLLGILKHDFDAVVVDSDEIIPSIRIAEDFFKMLQYGSQRNEAMGKIQVPVIKTIAVRPKGGDTALEVLTGAKTWKMTEPHPAHAFFSEDTLRQNLKQGLFARPALSSVLSQEFLTEDSLKPGTDSTVIIVGSVTGGTGGGLTAPILDTIRLTAKRHKTPNVKIRCVLFGEYFNPQPGLIQDDVVRFQSNQTMVLRSIGEAEASEYVHSYNIVGGPGFKGGFERKPEKEKTGMNLPWPKDETDPFWHGAQALDYLLTESAMEKKGPFKSREIQNFSSNFSLKEANLRRRKGLQMVAMLRKKNAIIRLCSDPWARWIWGGNLVDIARHYWSIAAKVEGGKEAVPGFPGEIQKALEAIWRGEGKERGLQDIFPLDDQSQRMRPGKMARIRWPQLAQGTWARELFDDAEMSARRAAATILFWTLREVK